MVLGNVSNLCYTTPAQTYLVVGGVDSSRNPLASTEVFTLGEAAWKQVGPLPVAVYGLRATTVSNFVYASGGYSYYINIYSGGGGGE